MGLRLPGDVPGLRGELLRRQAGHEGAARPDGGVHPSVPHYSAARHDLLPKSFTKVSRYDTPTAGNLFALSICVVYVATVALAKANPFLIFGINTTGGSILIQVIYAVLALVVVRAIPPAERRWWQWVVILGALLTPILAVYGSLSAPGALDMPGVIGVAGAGAIVALVSAWACVGASKIDEEALD